MKNLYLLLAIIGFIVPNIWVMQESIDTGNILLWLHPAATLEGMFANRISTAFIVDLLIVVWIFFIWSYFQAKQAGVKNVWIIWVLTLLFGMAGPFPLFLYIVERKKEMQRSRDFE